MFWRCGCLCSLLLIVVLTGCAVQRGLPTPQPTESAIQIPMTEQSYMPIITKNYKPGVFTGISGGLWGMSNPYYHWSISPLTTDERFVRMVWCLDDYHLTLYKPEVAIAARSDYEHKILGRVWLIMNEPDQQRDKAIGGQCGAYALTGNPFDPDNAAPRVHDAPEQVAVRYSQMYDLVKQYDPHAKIYAGGMGWIGFDFSREWWIRFVAELARRGELWKIDGVHVHSYPIGSFPQVCNVYAGCMQNMFEQLDVWYSNYHVALGLSGKPLWITETGGGPCAYWERWDAQAYTTIKANVMQPWKQWLYSAQNPGYKGLFWFVSWDGLEASWWCNYLVDNRSGSPVLTALGEEWSR